MWKEPVYVPNWRQLYLFYPPYESLGSTFLRGYISGMTSTALGPCFPAAACASLKNTSAQDHGEGPWGKFDNLASLPLPPPGITGLQAGHGTPRGDFQRWESSESDKSPQIQTGALKSHVTNWHKGGKKTAKSKTQSSFWCATIGFSSLRLIWIHHCWRGHILSLCLDKLLPSGSLLNWLFQ